MCLGRERASYKVSPPLDALSFQRTIAAANVISVLGAIRSYLNT